MSKNRVKATIYKILSFTKALPLIENVRLLTNFSRRYGYYNSIDLQSSIDNHGNPIPWFTYPAIEYLDSLNLSKARIFEWGSGQSSLYFSKRCLSVVSIESDKKWFDKISAKIKSRRINNLKIFLKSDRHSYIKFINDVLFSNILFDIVVIDGTDRLKCAKECLPKLKKNGIIILDNSDLNRPVVNFLSKCGYYETPFIGPGPINSYFWRTSFFRKK